MSRTYPYQVVAEHESQDGLVRASVARETDGTYSFRHAATVSYVQHGLTQRQALAMIPVDFRSVGPLPKLSERIDRTGSRKPRRRGRK